MKLVSLLTENSKTIEITNNNIYYRKPPFSQEQLKTVVNEKIKHIKYDQTCKLIKQFNKYDLTNKELKEIENSINEDKKICENCKNNIYDNNYHRGWKNNENGDYVLLCPNCSKKYFSGASEIRFDNLIKKQEEEMVRLHLNANSSNHSHHLEKTESEVPHYTRPSFAVIPPGGSILINNKRPVINSLY